MRTIPLVAGAAAACLATAASADIIIVNVDIEPGQEVSAPALGGATPSGSATVTINTDTSFVEIMGTYSGMTSNVTGSHLHGLAGFGVNAGILISLSNSGGTSGSFSGSGTLSMANFDGLMAGNTYINVHTTTNPGGEIRGQVIIPAPGAFAAAGLAGLATLRRRR
jgi:uncharacterized protein (TIGR03382 family)